MLRRNTPTKLIDDALLEVPMAPVVRVGPNNATTLMGVVALIGTLIVATLSIAAAPPSRNTLLGFAALVIFGAIAECFPVEAVGITAKGATHSLGIVFCVAAAILLGPVALVFPLIPRLIADQVAHKRAAVLITNAGGYGVSGLATYWVAQTVPHTEVILLASTVLACVATFYVVNIAWCSLCAGISVNYPVFATFRAFGATALIPTALMVPTCVMLVVLWQRWPPLALLLTSPLISAALYQRTSRHATLNLSAALTDTLTQLGNARAFGEFVKREIERADRTSVPLALCLIDLDGFKLINDTFGHPAGDSVLQAVAAELRDGGESFRLGGDEFALLLPGGDDLQASVAADRVLARIRALRFPFGGSIGGSAGIAFYPGDAPDSDELVAAADRALYEAKVAGKNRLRIAVRPPAAAAELG